MQVNITASVKEIVPFKTAEDLKSSIFEAKPEFVASELRRILRISINGDIDYAFSFINEPPLAQIDIYRQIFTFHNWLASEEAAVIKACPNYNRQLMVSLRTYNDTTVSPLST
jgi:hypothetical protein